MMVIELTEEQLNTIIDLLEDKAMSVSDGRDTQELEILIQKLYSFLI